MSPFRKSTAAILSGALLAFVFLHPPSGWLIIIALIPIFWLTQNQSPLQAFLLGWLSGTAGFIVGFAWFYPVVERMLVMNPFTASAAFFFLFAFHGLMIGLLTGAMRWLAVHFERSTGGYGPWALCAIPLYLTLEKYFPQFLPVTFADPFLSCLPSVQIAEFVGAAGPTALALFSNASIYILLDSARRRARGAWHEPLRWGLPLTALLVLAGNFIWGAGRMREVQAEADAAMEGPAGKVVAILQGMIPLSEKMQPEFVEANIGVYSDLTRQAVAEGPLDLVVWPQGAYERRLELSGKGWPPPTVSAGGQPFAQRMKSDLPPGVRVLLSGLATVASARGPRNYFAAWLVDEEARLGRLTTKRHLTPFSEFVPFSKIPLAHRFKPENFIPLRRGPQLVLPGPGGLRLGAYMCYEEVVAESARNYARAGANLLVPLSSNLQFGDSIGSELHLRFSVLRAVETRRYLARAVTSGVSAVIEPTGRIAARLEYGRRGYLRARLALLEETTLYVRIGDLVYQMSAALSLLLFLAARARSKT